MDLLKILATLGSGFATLLIADYFWISYVMKHVTLRELESLIVLDDNWKIQVNAASVLFVWWVMLVMIYVFILHSWLAKSPLSALWYGALLWFGIYAVYDFTNYAYIRDYSLTFSLIDIVWWTFLCAWVAFVMWSVFVRV